MNQPGDKPASLEARLLAKPPRTAGLDSHGQPVRLGERDRDGYLLGYTDEHGLARESVIEQPAATRAPSLARALAIPHDHPHHDELIEQALVDLPDELIADVARQAAGLLWLRGSNRGVTRGGRMPQGGRCSPPLGEVGLDIARSGSRLRRHVGASAAGAHELTALLPFPFCPPALFKSAVVR
jgi:hypothetical protein